jgi:RNA polymerase sigma factor (sigma-70 family)
MLAAPPLAALVRRMTPDSEGIPDAELIERFAKSADQAAFELLVWRHGAMVWSACKRMLSDHHAAEDACQATFLALSVHALRLHSRGSVAAWLHRVAVRASLDLLATRRSVLPLTNHFDPIDRHPGPEQLASDREVRLAIDSGLDRLPDSLRIPFVLCELEGRTNVEAAAALGCAVGTVESSLTRARKRLRKWIGSRGLAPAAALTSAAIPGSLRAALVSVGAKGSLNPAIRTLADRAVRSTVETNLRFAFALGAAMMAAAIGFGLEGGDAPKSPGTPTAKVTEPKAAEVNVPGFPEGAVARLGNPHLRHGSRLKDIAYSPNGKRLASVGNDNSVRVWDAESGLQLFSVAWPAGGFDRVSFAAEGAVIVVLGSDSDKKGALWRIDAANGQVLDRLKIEATMPSKRVPDAAVRFSADGSRLALGSVDKKHLLVFATADGKPVWTADLVKKFRAA